MKVVDNKRRLSRIRLYVYYKRDFWDMLKFNESMKYRRFIYSVLKGTRRFYREILFSVFRGQHFYNKKYTRRGALFVVKKCFKLFCSTIRDRHIARLGSLAKRLRGGILDNFCSLFELRLDMLIWRSLFVSTVRASRQFIVNWNVYVNSALVNKLSYMLNVGDIVSLVSLDKLSGWFSKKSLLVSGFYVQKLYFLYLYDFRIYVNVFYSFWFPSLDVMEDMSDGIFLLLLFMHEFFNWLFLFFNRGVYKVGRFFVQLKRLIIRMLRYSLFSYYILRKGRMAVYLVGSSWFFLKFLAVRRRKFFERLLRHVYVLRDRDFWVMSKRYSHLTRSMLNFMRRKHKRRSFHRGLVYLGYPSYLECSYKLFRALVVRRPGMYDSFFDFDFSILDVYVAYRSRGFF